MPCRLCGTDRYRKQYGPIVKLTHGNKFNWNLHQNIKLFFEENLFQNVVCKVTAIWSWSECINQLMPSSTFNDVLLTYCVMLISRLVQKEHNPWFAARCIILNQWSSTLGEWTMISHRSYTSVSFALSCFTGSHPHWSKERAEVWCLIKPLGCMKTGIYLKI